jgi:branched-chain amino acid transport system permease protein
MTKIVNYRLLVPILAIVFLAAFPLLRPSVYFLSFGFIVFMYVALAISWNIIGGFTGYLSFGHAAFFGIGAYTTSLLLLNYGLSPFLTAIPAGLLAAVFALVVGYPCLRVKGPYFALVTLCLGLAVPIFVLNVGWTGGATGLWLPFLSEDPFVDRAIFYKAMLGLTLLLVLIVRRIEKSKFGIGLSCIREDEDVAKTIGINATRLKIQAFVLSAFFTGIIGGVFAYFRTYIHPIIVFDPYISIIIVQMALLGGRRSWMGPILGACIVTIVFELLMLYVGAEAARITFGLGLIGTILFLPNGIITYIVGRRRLPKVINSSA